MFNINIKRKEQNNDKLCWQKKLLIGGRETEKLQKESARIKDMDNREQGKVSLHIQQSMVGKYTKFYKN